MDDESREERDDGIADDAVIAFVDWLYETCPVAPDEVPRTRLLELWNDHRFGIDHIWAKVRDKPKFQSIREIQQSR